MTNLGPQVAFGLACLTLIACNNTIALPVGTESARPQLGPGSPPSTPCSGLERPLKWVR